MRIRHGRLELELHALGDGHGLPLLLLHALGGASSDWEVEALGWSGPVYALDFAGHGLSEWVAGGGYYPELFAADADAVLATVGPAAIAGTGLGAYVALLLAGARPDLVPAALLLSGAGLAGGGAVPNFDKPAALLDTAFAAPSNGCDPMVHVVDLYIRPVEYVLPVAAAASHVLLAEDDEPRPPWWEAVRTIPHTRQLVSDVRDAFAALRDVVVQDMNRRS